MIGSSAIDPEPNPRRPGSGRFGPELPELAAAARVVEAAAEAGGDDVARSRAGSERLAARSLRAGRLVEPDDLIAAPARVGDDDLTVACGPGEGREAERAEVVAPEDAEPPLRAEVDRRHLAGRGVVG